MKIEITEKELNAIFEMGQDIEQMIGCSETDDDGYNWDVEMKKRLALMNRMLKRNGYLPPFLKF